jgi:hypothetical protein
MSARGVAFGLLLALPCLAGAAPVPGKDVPVPRVLLAAGGPTRDYQFLRTFLVREEEQKRTELRTYVQPPPGQDAPRPGFLSDEDRAHPLKHFPEQLRHVTEDKPDEKPYNLANYDVLIAFDLDWTRLKPEQLERLKKWAEAGGGLILVAGPINTLQLARPGAGAAKLQPIRDLLPVVLEDPRIENERDTSKPRRLHFPETKTELPFLKLDPKAGGRLAGWDEYFDGAKGEAKNKEPLHGFFNYFPVKSAKEDAVIAATFTEPGGAKQPPFLVVGKAGKGHVVYLGSGETWRLRQSNEAYHENLWRGLVAYAAGSVPERKQADEPKKDKDAPPAPEEVSMEVQALRVLYAMQTTPEQMKGLAKLAKGTAQPSRERTKAKVSKAFLQTLTELRGYLVEANDEDEIDALVDKLGQLQESDKPELDDGVEITAAARKQAPAALRLFKAQQVATYLGNVADDVPDPLGDLLDALEKMRGLDRDTWKVRRDELAEEIGWAVAGLDEEKADKINDQVTMLLSKVRGLSAEQFKTQRAELEKAAQAIIGELGPTDVLRHFLERQMAELLSNPCLQAALKARLK